MIVRKKDNWGENEVFKFVYKCLLSFYLNFKNQMLFIVSDKVQFLI